MNEFLWIMGLFLFGAQIVVVAVGSKKARTRVKPAAPRRDAPPDIHAAERILAKLHLGHEAEPVWGAWLRVKDFDQTTDVLMVSQFGPHPVRVLRCVSSSGDTYLMLSDGSRIVLERVARLSGPADEYLVCVQESPQPPKGKVMTVLQHTQRAA